MEYNILDQGIRFIWKNARLLERAIYDYRFQGASPGRILRILRAYQNDDGGFGHALEPDLRTPESQPLFVEFALRTLYECKLRDAELTSRAVTFLAHHSDLSKGIAPIFSSSNLFPRAAHWNNPASVQPSFDRLTGLVGLAKWQNAVNPWLEEAVDICLSHIGVTQFDDAHTILNAFCLLESVADERDVESLNNKLAEQLSTANFFCLDVPVKTYGLTPLTFAPAPDAYCRRIFSDKQIDTHLDDLEVHQQTDGGWPITWEPPSETALWEWRAYWTLSALTILHAYGRI